MPGIGIGFVAGLLPVILTAYFDRGRTAACGLSYAGAGVGAFVFPLVFQHLLDVYGLQGSLLLMGGLSLHAVCAALLLSPPDRRQEGRGGSDIDPRSLLLPREEAAEQTPHECVDTRDQVPSATAPPSADYACLREMPDVAKCVPRAHGSRERVASHSGTSLASCSAFGPTFPENRVSSREGESQSLEPQTLSRRVLALMARDAQLLKKSNFFLITITYISYIMGNVTLLMILPDYVMTLGHSRSRAVFLLSLFSVTDLLGRLLPGLLSYVHQSRSNKMVYVLSIGGLGFLLISFPLLMPVMGNLSDSWLALVCLTLACGLASGCQMVLPPVVAAESLGLENTAMAFAFCNFFCGVFSLTRPLIFSQYLEPLISPRHALRADLPLSPPHQTASWIKEGRVTIKCSSSLVLLP